MNIGSLTIEMLAKLTGLEQGMNQAKGIIGRTMGDIESAVRSANKVLGLFGAGLSLAVVQAMLASATAAAREAEEASVKLDVIIRNTGNAAGFTKGQIDAMADSLSRATQFDDESIRNAASELLKFGNITGQVFTDALDVAAGYAAFSKTDLVSSAEAVGKALANPESAARLLRTTGVVLTAQQKDLMQSLIDTGKTSDVQAIIMTRLKEVYAGTAQEMNTGILKSTTGVSKAWDEMMESLGKTSVVSGIVDVGLGVIEGALNGIKGVADGDLIPMLKNILGLQEDIVGLRGLKNPYIVDPEPSRLSKPAGGMSDAEYLAQKKASEELAAARKKAAEEAARSYASAVEHSKNYIATLNNETAVVGLNSIQTKLMTAAREAANAPLASQRSEIMQSAQAWALATQAQQESVEAAKALEAEDKKRLEGYTALVSADEKSLESLRQKNNLLEYGATAIQNMATADLQAALDRAWAANNIDPEVINMLQQRLDLSKQIADETKRGAVLQAAKDGAKATLDAWQNTARDINLALTNALFRGFESGKSFAQNLRDTMVNMFQTVILRPVINAVMGPVSTAMSGMIGGLSVPGMASAGTGAGAGAAGAVGGFMPMLSGFLTSAAPALGVAAAAFAVGSLTSAFGAGKKIFGIKGDSPLNFIAPIIGILAGLFGKGPKQYGPQMLNGNFTQAGFDGNFQADWTRKVGLFGGKKKGTTDFAISSEQDALLDDTVTGITDTFDKFIKTAGEADRSLAGWTFNVRRQIETEEQQKQLTIDLANSIGQKLVPELAALQIKGESLVETAARAQQEFALMTAAIDLTGQSFGATGLASLGLRDNLVQLLGGLQSAGALLQPFFDNFYTDAERVASTGRLMNAELSKMGLGAIPTTREQFRDLVEAQDLSTDAGQEMFAALIQLAPAFATVTDAIGKAADDAAAEAKRIADSIQLLTTDSFATLFDYTKYIRLAANAGVTAAQPAGPVFQAPAQVFHPSFAVGTNNLPGDMTAQVHKGERIVPAADNRELMQRLSEPNEGMRVMADEIKQLRAELRTAHFQLAKNTGKTARNTDAISGTLGKWDVIGQPPQRSA